jgi:asparagine synthase (glutamine-hydrolysing)
LVLTARVEAVACGTFGALGPGREAMVADRLERLPGAMLTKVDVASMSASIEVRVPLLDDALVRFADGVDESELIGWRRGKLLLRRVLADVLPGQLVSAPKRGFYLPLDEWLRAGETAKRLHLLFVEERDRLADLTGLDVIPRLRDFAMQRDPPLVTAEEILWLTMVALWARRFAVTTARSRHPDEIPFA